ncbi:MAG TPA: mycofactocin precursor MftA [Ktedonobacteraceae bacterium]
MPETTFPGDIVSANEITITESPAPTLDPPLPEEALPSQEELLPEDGLEEELIIEDFTIDGICGVY